VISQKPHSVLIVEDERIVAKDLQQALSAMGYDAFAIASSGDEAIACASERYLGRRADGHQNQRTARRYPDGGDF
jgi:CheY-like chemotaxis protein